jgi:hypothetical protein
MEPPSVKSEAEKTEERASASSSGMATVVG